MSKYSTYRLSKRLGLLLLACVLFAAFAYAPNASAVVRVASGSGYELSAYDLLSEYGEWIDLPPYGVVWCPYVDESWAPFSDGRWIWTSYGWAWDSYEAFGEIVYHYGYWYRADDIGWFWVPGDEWSPARVQWYTYMNYCAWAPLPPPKCYWPDPWDDWPYDVWIVVDYNNFCDGHVGHRRIAPTTERRVVTPGSDVRVKREVAAPENRIRVTTPGESRSGERKAAMPAVERRTAPPEQRQVAKPTLPSQREQVATSRSTSKSAPPAQSRTEEKGSDRDDKATQRGHSN